MSILYVLLFRVRSSDAQPAMNPAIVIVQGDDLSTSSKSVIATYCFKHKKITHIKVQRVKVVHNALLDLATEKHSAKMALLKEQEK